MKPFDWTRLFRRPYKVYVQTGLWIVVFFLFIVLKEYPRGIGGWAMICIVLQDTVELAIPSYTQNLLVLPVFRRGKWILGIFCYLLQVALLIWLLPYLLNWVGLLFAAWLPAGGRVDWRREHIGFSMLAFTIVATVFKIALDRLVMEKEQKENELRHLKAQLNPHFLFNTLNNLYGLSVVGSEKLPGLMLKLSDLLRYSLYDTGQHYVPLQKELDYIANYVELERIRLNDKTEIVLHIEGEEMFVKEQYIAPLLLIVFIENAFKHFSVARGGQGFVHIYFVLREGRLDMKVENSVAPSYLPGGPSYVPGVSSYVPVDPPPIPEENKRRPGGLGLNNVKQRLDLIYPGRHELKINKGADRFEVNLEIDLR